MITPGFVAASSAGDGDPLTQSSGNRAAESAQPGPRILKEGETEMVTLGSRLKSREQGPCVFPGPLPCCHIQSPMQERPG